MVSINTHSGTHLDAPAHFCKGGGTVLDVLEPWTVLFPTICLDVPATGSVGIPASILDGASAELFMAEGLLLRTGVHRLRAKGSPQYEVDHPFLEPALADELVDRFPALRLVGIDTLSVAHPDRKKEGAEVHRRLLCHHPPILIMEDIDLSRSELTRGPFHLVFTPLIHDRLDGAPVVALANLPEIRPGQ